MIGHRLKSIRTHQGLTQLKLGQALGLDGQAARGTIWAYEADRKVPSLHRLCELAEALGVSPAELLK